jgi:hypothetical protein
MTAYEPNVLRGQLQALVRLAMVNKGLAERYGLDSITLDIAKKVAQDYVAKLISSLTREEILS